MADHKIDGNDGAGNVDLIRRIDAMQACQVGPSDEWSKATKDGYNQAATDCAMAILRVAPVPAANDEVASYKMAAMECELECKALRAQRDDAWGRADHALALAADVIDRDIKKIQPEMTRRGQRLADGKKPGFQYAIHRADLDARISCRDKILALRDKPAPAVTPKIEVKFTWAKGDEEFWVHLKAPDGKSVGFNLGNPKGMIATALLRAIAGGGDE